MYCSHIPRKPTPSAKGDVLQPDPKNDNGVNEREKDGWTLNLIGNFNPNLRLLWDKVFLGLIDCRLDGMNRPRMLADGR